MRLLLRAGELTPMLLLLAATSWADVTYTEKTTEEVIHLLTGAPREKSVSENRVWIKGEKVKFVTKDRVFVFRPDKKLWWDIYPEQKAYYETTYASFENLGAQALAKLPALEQQLATLPEHRKKAFEIWKYRLQEHLGKVAPPKDPTEVQEPAEEQEVDGAKCKHKVVTWSTQVLFDGWFDPTLEGFASLVGMYEATRAFAPSVLARLRALPGFPRKGTQTVLWLTGDLATVTFSYGDFKTAPVPDEEFELPPGLVKK